MASFSPSPATSFDMALQLYQEWKSQSKIELKFLCMQAGIDLAGLPQPEEARDFIHLLCDRFSVYEYTTSMDAFNNNLKRRTSSGLASTFIFLDVDGVLNLPTTLQPIRLHMECGSRIVKLVSKIGDASIVLSSTWRKKPLLILELLSFLAGHGADGDLIVGVTPDKGGVGTSTRGFEIQEWLAAKRPNRPVPYIMIDDLPFSPHHGRGVWTDPYKGLMDIDIEKALFKVQYQKAKGPDVVIPPALV